MVQVSELTHGSLFSGIGGFDLGADREGIKTLWNCEIDPQNRKWLKQNFPETKQYDDILTLQKPPYVDIISGGFPCQDISIANQYGKGITGSRSSLWGQFERVISEVNPRYVIIENSSAIHRKGLEVVLCDLAEMGYDAEWQALQGTFFAMQQRRERIYIIAYPRKERCERKLCETVFREQSRVLQREFERVAPGWPDRQSIPEPRTIGRLNGLPRKMVEAYGNSVMPRAAQYLFWCIKQDFKMTKDA